MVIEERATDHDRRGDHDLLIEMRTYITEILRRMSEQDSRFALMETRARESDDNHRKEIDMVDAKHRDKIDAVVARVEKVENFRWYVAGAVGFLVILAPLIYRGITR